MKKQEISVNENMEKRALLWQCSLVQPLRKTVWRLLKKFKIKLSYDSAIPLLGIYSKKMKTLTEIDICTPMFIAAIFTIAEI